MPAQRLVVLTAGIVAVAIGCGGSQPAVTVPAPPVVAAPTAPPEIVPTAAPATAPAPPRAVAQPALIATPLPGDTAQVTIHRLSNGLTVYLSPDPSAATIVAHVVVHAGSSNDPQTSTGLAHYLEHMMLFKGTEHLGTLDYAKEKPHLDHIAALYDELRGSGGDRDRDRILAAIDAETVATSDVIIPNELESVYNRMGIARSNAFTDSDQTIYVCELPKNRLAQWARLQAERFVHPVFRLFWPELEAVYEEKNRAIDNPGRTVYRALYATMFPHHGYGWSDTLGEIEHLKKPAYADMVAFFERYYTPANMAIVLSGGIDDQTLPTLERELAGFRRPAGAARGALPLAQLHGRTPVDVTVPSQPGVVLAWPLPAANAPDTVVIAVMDLLASDHGAGIIERDLRLPQKVAGAGAGPDVLREAGVWQLWGDQLDGQTADQVEQLLLGVVAKLQRGDFTDGDLAGAVLATEVARARQLETSWGRVEMMDDAFATDTPWADVVGQAARIRAITRADIVRVANQYLTGDFIALHKVKGVATPAHLTKPRITPYHIDPSRHSAFADAVLAMPVAPIEPVAAVEGADYHRGKLPTGELVTVENHRNDLFAIGYEYDYGTRDDRLVCVALDALAVAGAGDRSAEQLSRDLYALGVTVSAWCGADRSGIAVSGVDRNLPRALALLHDHIAAPRLDTGTVARAIATIRTARANAIDDPGTVKQAVHAFAHYGDDSGWRVVASDRQLAAATAAQLDRIIARYLTMAHRTSYFGPRAAADAAAVVGFGDGTLATTPRAPWRYRPAGAVVACDRDTAQTDISIVWPRPPATDDERALGELFYYYAGQRVFREVRGARGLAYSVWAGWGAGGRSRDDAGLWAAAGTQADKTDETIAALLETLRQPVDDDRLAEAKQRVEEQHRADRIDPRDLGGAVYSWEDQGVRADPRDARVRRILAVERARLDAWASRIVAGKPIVSVVGPRKLVDEGKLGKIAPVTWIPATRAFGY